MSAGPPNANPYGSAFVGWLFGQMALEGDSLTSRLPGKRAPVVAATGFKFTAPAAIATNYRSDRHGEAVAKVAEGNFMFVGMER